MVATYRGDEVVRLASRLISAMACYGPKAGPLRDVLTRVQALIAEHAGDDFRPYSLDQIHATLIALDGVPDPDTGAIVNEAYLLHAGRAAEMDLARVMEILAGRFAAPLRIRIGGFRRDQEIPFTSRDQHLFDRTFSVQGNAFVVVGWPVVSLAGAGRPLDDLRRSMNAAGVLHRYHVSDTDVDNDLHLVVGHHAGAQDSALSRAESAVRDWLAGDPVEFGIGLSDVKVVASESRTMAPPLYVSGLPADETAMLALMMS
jgi:hypothetical protein